MSIADLLPVRIGHARPARKHRAIDEVDRLAQLLGGANALIRGLQLQVADRDALLADTRAKQAEAEELVVQLQADVDDLTAERDELRAEVTAYRAAAANANRITVPPMVRDTSDPADQATAPIDVRPLWDALGVRAVTDPGRIR
ncbi:hypothetical protein ACF1AL_14625 [Streptomyces sp. NPDC014801]|uniref:hypothetical protein n=1 Tax=Streptomyces sp. NPDC014801 TaxID=3364916 RepID=UPI0036FE29F5